LTCIINLSSEYSKLYYFIIIIDIINEGKAYSIVELAKNSIINQYQNVLINNKKHLFIRITAIESIIKLKIVSLSSRI
jgi:ATP-dependent protease Clp ATPase subunit